MVKQQKRKKALKKRGGKKGKRKKGKSGFPLEKGTKTPLKRLADHDR